LIAFAGLSVTVPALGEGIRPRGPSTLPSLPTSLIIAGVDIATSKSIQPPKTFSINSSAPTVSAPASLAALALSSLQKTMTFKKEDLDEFENNLLEDIKEIEESNFQCSKNVLCVNCEYRLLCN
jgi:hypothetical protein